MKTRHLAPEDFEVVTAIVDEWWGGRAVRHLLPRLFFEHFSNTSFAVLDGSEIAAFLVGFRSQSRPETAYIHFVGVAPEHRGRGVAFQLYQQFFSTVRAFGCNEVRCITSPANSGSIAFHRRLGFSILPGDGEEGGLALTRNYAGPGQHRVQFHLAL